MCQVLHMHIALIFALSQIAFGGPSHMSIKWNSHKRNYEVNSAVHDQEEFGNSSELIAWGSFQNDVNVTGWAYLEIYTNASFDDTQQAYGAGLLEGIMTKQMIDMHWQNTYNGYCVKPFSKFCQKLQQYLNDNMVWVTQQIAAHAETDPYWHQVELFLEQMSGLMDGYSNTPRFPAKFNLDVTTIALLQISGDLEDLESAFNKANKHILGSGSCSALIKVLPGNKDLYVAQDTWNGFDSMLRILKKYDFKFKKTGAGKDPVPAEVMTFSSYPGTLMSGDDFYIMNSGLVTIETTIGNSNPKLWSDIKTTLSVLEGIRNMVANRLSMTGKEWVTTFSRYNSGTYNNQWMVTDYKTFKPGKPLPDSGLLYVLEQLPGMIVMEDMTKFLQKQTYWPSYNIPYFKDIFKKGGNEESVKKYGDWFTYDKSPRANIFRRDHSKVKDLDTMTKLMRYNDYTHDPLSRCNCTPPYSAENAISARSDLNPADGKYPFSALGHRAHGGIDMKLTSSSMVPDLEFIALSSPAYDDVPVFQWSKTPFESTVKHVGQPDLWNFKPITHKWMSRK